MRVIAGSARGLKLNSLSGDNTRPTTDRVKEALFSMIQFELNGARVWDAFAGSGALGIEALSRGAAFVTFTEQAPKAIKVIKSNLKNSNLENYKLIQTRAEDYLEKTSEKFDVVFLDPPYNQGFLQKLLDKLTPKLKDGAIVIIEHNGQEQFELEKSKFNLEKEKKYGKIQIHIYRRIYANSDLSR